MSDKPTKDESFHRMRVARRKLRRLRAEKPAAKKEFDEAETRYRDLCEELNSARSELYDALTDWTEA